MTDSIFLLGACGQVGTELTLKLREIYGNTNVITADLKEAEGIFTEGVHYKLNALDGKGIIDIVKKHQITHIYHLAALLSGTAEKNPMYGWELNMESLLSVLNIARDNNIKQVYWPSSIAVFGPTTPRFNTPQDTIMAPNTVYGISKLAGERWCEYYFNKYKLDVRSIRYPGLISHSTEPGGGTTDYAVHIFYDAIKSGKYSCFLSENTALPMLYMPDAIKGTLDLMHADSDKIKIRSSYNLSGFSFTPDELFKLIKISIPQLEISYLPDFRQAIADSWPASIDDTQAREQWGWKPDFSLQNMVTDMLENIKEKLTQKA